MLAGSPTCSRERWERQRHGADEALADLVETQTNVPAESELPVLRFLRRFRRERPPQAHR